MSDKDPRNLDDAYRLAVTMKANTRGAELRRAQEGGRWGGQRADVRAAFRSLMASADMVEYRDVNSGAFGRKAGNNDMADMRRMVEDLCKTVSTFCAEGE